jgi:site-specific recombinase XerD
VAQTRRGLNEQQLEQIITCYSDDAYDDVRDKAMVGFYASSGLGSDEVLKRTVDNVDPYSGWVRTLGKGRKERIVRITERARKYLWRLRPAGRRSSLFGRRRGRGRHTLDLLARLVDKSLLVVEQSPRTSTTRYRLLDPCASSLSVS